MCENASEGWDVGKKKKKSHAASQGCFTSFISETPSNNGSNADWVEIQKQFSLMEMFLYWSSSWINWIRVMSTWKSLQRICVRVFARVCVVSGHVGMVCVLVGAVCMWMCLFTFASCFFLCRKSMNYKHDHPPVICRSCHLWSRSRYAMHSPNKYLHHLYCQCCYNAVYMFMWLCRFVLWNPQC